MANEMKSWHTNKNEVVVSSRGLILGLSLAGEGILRLRCNRGDRFQEEETFVVDNVPQRMDLHVEEVPWGLVLMSGSLEIRLGLEPLALEIIHGGRCILSSSTREFLEVLGGNTVLRLRLQPDERIYGLGQDPMACLNQRDRERRMWQEWGGTRRSGNAGMPFYMSSCGYGLLLNSSYPSRFAIGRATVAEAPPAYSRNMAPAPWDWEEHSGEDHPEQLAILLDHPVLDTFIICKDAFDDIHKAYCDLTGHAPMLPKWALGFIQCKNRYRSQEELLAVAEEYRRRGIPCDVLVIDWLWFEYFGDLAWYAPEWPDPKQMLKKLTDMGFHVMSAQHPYLNEKSRLFKKFREEGWANEVPAEAQVTVDHSYPQARQAWWEEVKRLYEDGIRGYWTDMGEIEEHKPGTESYLGSRERVHNIYSLLWAKGLYEGQRRDFGERVFSLHRTAYPGIQRYGTALWSGDISATWEVLRDQVVIGQGVSMSGQPYWCSDIGGFMLISKEFTAELYVRWFQWGTFCPVFRTHGTRSENEAWTFGKQAEGIITEFIRLRYRLLPYIYSCTRKVTEEGTPIMRAMCMDFGDDPVAVEQELQFMFGPALLVAPVVENGSRSRRVYLPEGTWYDFWTGERYAGRQWIMAAAPLSRIPLYARAGSIIPMGPVLQHTGEDSLHEIELHAYAGDEGSFELYEDDGLTYEYEKGYYAKTLLSMDAAGRVVVSDVKRHAGIVPQDRRYTVVLHDGCEADSCSERVCVEVDIDVSTLSVCSIHAIITNNGPLSAAVRAELVPPQGWGLRKTPDNSYEIPQREAERQVDGFTHLRWELVPIHHALPLVHRGSIIFDIEAGKGKSQVVREFSFGSGYATRWSLAQNFDNTDKNGLDRMYGPEMDPELPCYTDGDRRLHWGHSAYQDYNCQGYIQLELYELHFVQGTRGVAYARCRVWSETETEVFVEIQGEPSLKVFFNETEVFRTASTLFTPVVTGPVRLLKGWNSVMVKVAFDNDRAVCGREYGFRFRMVDREGKLLEKLLYQP